MSTYSHKSQESDSCNDPGHVQSIQEKNEDDGETQEIVAMKQKSVFSLAWSIADNRCYMTLLQICVIGLCGFSLLISYSQFNLDAVDIECDSDSQVFGPYLGDKSGIKYGCPWPEINEILRMIAPGIGLISGVITIFLQFCLGRKVLLDMNSFNETRRGDEQIEYFDIYSFCWFRFIRKVIGYAAYIHFISFGIDLCSYFVGKEYGLNQLGLELNNSDKFELVLYIAIPVSILLRLTHDSMYQRLYKRKFGLVLAINNDKQYQGATINEHNIGATVLELEPDKLND